MKEALEKLWDEYLAEECAVIDSEEEKDLLKKAVTDHEAVTALLTKEQSEAVEKCIDTLCDIHSFFAKKAFCKGCEFATSFLLATGKFERT